LAKHSLNVDIIIQTSMDKDTTNISFSVKTKDVEETIQVLEQYKDHLGFTHIEKESNLAKVSIVGSGMISNPGVAAEMFQVLATEGIHVKMVSTSEIKVSTVVDVEVMVKAVEALHVAFKLGEESVERVLN